jgi:parallel beta-helix repeat protein
MIPRGQQLRRTIVVRPGQSIQAAIDKARHGTRIFVLAGDYTEPGNDNSALRITKSGIRLIGQTLPKRRVVLRNAGGQSNGITVVPEDRTDCMSCHESLAPPFPLWPGVPEGMPDPEPVLHDLEIRGITIEGFDNNGLFTERVDGFKIIDVESIDNPNYGIFPTLSKNGLISHSRAVGSDDSGIWVETSENVTVTHNVVEANVNGFEVSNSDDILFAHNVVRDNTVGFALLTLPDIFDERPGANRITVRDNWIARNNKENTATSGSVLAEVPAGTGVLLIGPDFSTIENNHVQDHDFFGIAVADYCLTVFGTPFSCLIDPGPPGFLDDESSSFNRIIGNVLINNGNNVPDGHSFAFAAGDISIVTAFDRFNCVLDNILTKPIFTFFGGPPPECE